MLEAKERARAKRLELEEQLSFLANERENNRELEGKIADLDRTAVRLHQGSGVTPQSFGIFRKHWAAVGEFNTGLKVFLGSKDLCSLFCVLKFALPPFFSLSPLLSANFKTNLHGMMKHLIQ